MAKLTDEEEGSNFEAFMGSFGSHSNLKQRRKNERLASLKPNDKRRKRVAVRTEQLNVRVSEETIVLVNALIEKLRTRDNDKWSKPDVIEAAIAAMAKAENIKGAA